MSGHTPGPRRLYFFVHNDGSVTETDVLHADAAYVRADIADEMLAALEEAVDTIKALQIAYASARGISSEKTGFVWHYHQTADMRRAIAKAKGEAE